jgi:hypothetical protein
MLGEEEEEESYFCLFRTSPRTTRSTCLPDTTYMAGTLAVQVFVDRRLLVFLQFLLQESLEEPRSLTTF